MMKKITLLINTPKDFETNAFKQKFDQLPASDQVEILIISYENKNFATNPDYPVFSVDVHEDLSFSQVLKAISTDHFLFFNPETDYPANFLKQMLSNDEEDAPRETGSMWEEGIIAVQQSHYGLCGSKLKASDEYNFLNESALYTKKEVESLNTDKMSVHPELSGELYRYATKKKLELIHYIPKKEKVVYITQFAALMIACQNQAQKEFKTFPALFVLFFLIFGVGAAFSPLFFLLFLMGMSVYLLAITLESFGLSTIKKNGGLLVILLFLFPFIHLVYGLESLIAKIRTKR
jgi:hypothetical protein